MINLSKVGLCSRAIVCAFVITQTAQTLFACGTAPSIADAEMVSDAVPVSDASPLPPCVVGPVPTAVIANWGLAPFYRKHVDFRGFPILSSEKTPDAALCNARDVLDQMLAFRTDIIGRLISRKIRLALMAATEVTTDSPSTPI
jgi:hypothetical protein